MPRYKPKRRIRYVSKEYQRYKTWLHRRYFGVGFSGALYTMANTPGFARRLLDPQYKDYLSPGQLFMKALLPYRRHKRYAHLINLEEEACQSAQVQREQDAIQTLFKKAFTMEGNHDHR